MRAGEVSSVIQGFVDRLTDAVCFLSPEGTILYANSAYDQSVGSVASPLDAIHPEDRDDWQAALAQIQPGSTQIVTTRILRAQSVPIVVRWELFFLDEVLTAVLHFSSPTRAREASANLAAIIESSDDAIVSKTLDSIVTSWNPGAERIFGYGADEMIGQSITKLIPSDRLSEEDDIIEKLRSGKKVDHFETIRQTKDGRLIDVSVTVSPIRNQHGEIVGASKVARVITERKLAELALKESERHLRGLTELLEQRVNDRTADLQAALREMEGFTYTISHDLRAPLRAIIANCRLLEEDFADTLPEAARRHLQRQSDAARKLATLIDDLLRLSRIGRQALQKVDVDLTAMAEDVVEELRLRAPEATFIVAPNLRVKADPLLLRLALQNLLENATKFVRPNTASVVELGAERDAFFVRDNGIGFDPIYADRIFLPFERLHRDAEYPGTGIGLANVRRIVERHGGKVWATSLPNEGATFSFRLPNEATN